MHKIDGFGAFGSTVLASLSIHDSASLANNMMGFVAGFMAAAYTGVQFWKMYRNWKLKKQKAHNGTDDKS